MFLIIAHAEKVRNEYVILIGKPEGKGNFGDLDINRWIVLTFRNLAYHI